MPNILEVIRELKGLQAKQSAGVASAADLARIQELQGFMQGSRKPDPAPVAPPPRPPAGAAAPPVRTATPASPSNAPTQPAVRAVPASPSNAPTVPAVRAVPPVSAPVAVPTAPSRPAPASMPAPSAPAVPPPARAAAPAAVPARKAPDPQPDENAFKIDLGGDLLSAFGDADPGDEPITDADRTTHAAGEDVDNPFALSFDEAELGDDGPDESHGARTSFEIGDDDVAAASASDDNPFALSVPDELENLDLGEGDGPNETHELEESELDGIASEGDPFRVSLSGDFAEALEKADGSAAQAAPARGPKGTPMVPDAHYASLKANDQSVVVFLRDGRMGKGVAAAFTPTAAAVTLNQLLPGKPPIAIKLEECMTIRFVRDYNGPLTAAEPFPPKAPPAAGGVAGERVVVKLLDGETLVGTAMPHKPGESFFLVPAVNTGNVRRIWIAAKAVRSRSAA